jgi:hypothetical protein
MAEGRHLIRSLRWSLRTILVLTFILYVLGWSRQVYQHLLRGIYQSKLLTEWVIISTFALPLAAGLLALLGHRERNTRAMAIDFLGSVLWLVFFWASVYYTSRHHAVL